MDRRRPEPMPLVAGVAIALFGAVILLDQLDVVDVSLAALAPLVCALLGAILLATGLARRN